jgi:hypothetical protein
VRVHRHVDIVGDSIGCGERSFYLLLSLCFLAHLVTTFGLNNHYRMANDDNLVDVKCGHV